MTINEIHERAIRCTKECLKAEAALLEALNIVDKRRVFEALGYPSLFKYCTDGLALCK